MGDTHTLVPGWVRVVGTFDPEAPNGTPAALPEGTEVVDSKPTSADPGALIWFNGNLHRWDIGAVERIVTAKAEELRGLLLNSLGAQDFDL